MQGVGELWPNRYHFSNRTLGPNTCDRTGGNGFGCPEKCACCFAEARQFDFWLGDWETYTPDGRLAGTNSITLDQDSCLIRESWKSHGSAYTGTSCNFYNPRTGHWQQLWIDNQGGHLQLEGNLNGTAMILQSEELPNQDKKLQIDRITWTPNADGTVRQLWEVSTGKGNTWQVVFDGLYKRKTQ